MEQLVALRKRRGRSDSHRHAGRRKEPREFGEAKKSKTAPLKNKGCGTLRRLRATISVSGDSSKPLSHPPVKGLGVANCRNAPGACLQDHSSPCAFFDEPAVITSVDAAFSWFVCFLLTSFLLTSFLLTSFLHALHLGGNQAGDAEVVAAVPGVQRLTRAGEFSTSLYSYVRLPRRCTISLTSTQH